MTEGAPPVGLVERVQMIVAAVEAVCGPTDDPTKAGMRVATFCLALNFHMAHESDQIERARNYVAQVRDISGCTGEDLAAAIALYSIRAQDMLAQEIERIQAARQELIDEYNRLAAEIEDREEDE